MQPKTPPKRARNETVPPAERKGHERARTRRAANDDVRSVGNLLYALQRRPSYTPFWAALLVSIAWAGLGVAFGFSMWGDEIASLGSVEGVRSSPQLLGLTIGILGPILLFWGIAVLVWRGQEMRMVSRTMTEVALRLAEPENIAKESVVTVSQAIRREVAAMGDGIERALARASELEVLVHNEVASLERSYTDNELRVRRLIDELVTEREAIVQNAERVRQAIRGSHDSFSADLAGITDQIAVAADAAAKRISDLLCRPQPGDHADAWRHRRAGGQSARDAQRQSLPSHQRGRRQALRHDHQSRRPPGRAAEQRRRQRLRDVP